MKKFSQLLIGALIFALGIGNASATLSTTTSRIQYSCNGTTTVFAYPFKIYEDDDLSAIIADSDLTETTLVLNTDYTVSGAGGSSGGNLTLTAGGNCPSGYTLTMLRNIDLTQDTDYVNGQATSMDALEAPPDKSRIIDQQFNEVLNRSVRIPASSTASAALPAPEASKVFRWNSAGTAIEFVSLGSSTLSVPADESITGAMIKSTEKFNFPTLLQLQKGADVASANALTLGADGNYFDITGTTSITSISTVGIGTVVRLHFDGALTLTHHATDLVLPGGANITTAAGDEAVFVEYTVGDWRCINYQRASSLPVIIDTAQTITGNKTFSGNLKLTKGADVVSEAALFTTAGFPSDGNYFDVYSTNAVTSIITSGNVGTRIVVHFDGALTLTHHATDLILPGASNITTVAGDEAEFIEYASGDWRCVNYQRSSKRPDTGKIVQTVNIQDGEVATGTTVVPLDDTIMQNTEGDEYMTLAITPTKSTNKLRISVNFYGSNSANARVYVGLFQDSTADALAVASGYSAAGDATMISFEYEMTAGTTSATTFKIRAGSVLAGTTTFNGEGGSRLFGGVLASSIIITEIEV